MIDWKRIDTVFLDLDGTLLDLSFDNYFWRDLVPRQYAAALGLSIPEAKIRIAERYQRMEGALEWYCLDYWSGELQLDLIALKREVAGAIGVLPHAEDFLESLQRLPVRVVLVTNAHPASLSLKMNETGLGRYFCSIVCSHSLGLPKESPIFWARLQDIEPFPPERTLLVDDNLAVLQAARACGVSVTIAIRQPDSRLPPRIIDDFMAVDDFRDIMPPGPRFVSLSR